MSKRVLKMGWIVVAALLCVGLTILPACGGGGPDLPSEYIGSGALDGNGIPYNFFNDTNVRKGCCYAFNYPTYIASALSGQGAQRGSPVVEGLYGYNPAASKYNYNITKARELFETSGWGNLSAIGFKFTLLYNVGNLPRKTACVLLAEGLYAVSPNFNVAILPLAWPTILSKIYGTRDMPLYQVGWGADYAHADNFIVPFMHSQGSYSAYQGYGNAALDADIQAALEDSNSTTQLAKYYALQERYYQDAPGIALAQPFVRRYFTGHISGFTYNPVDPSYPCDVRVLSKANNGSSSVPYLNAGNFIEDTISELDSLDPAWGYDTASGEQVEFIYETLLAFNGSSTSTFVPRLATNWSFNLTDNTLRFTIRPGVNFSRGHPMTPEDVEYSFERAMTQDRDSGPCWMFFAPLLNGMRYEDTNWTAIDQSVKVDGGDVVFKLYGNWWEIIFKQILSGPWSSIVDKDWCIAHGDWNGTEADIANHLHPALHGDTVLYDVNAMGTGPWKLDNWNHGSSIKVVKNADYWDTGFVNPFDSYTTKSVNDYTQRKLDLINGQADLVYVPATMFGEMDLEAPGKLNVWRNLPALSFDAFFFNMIIGGPPA